MRLRAETKKGRGGMVVGRAWDNDKDVDMIPQGMDRFWMKSDLTK